MIEVETLADAQLPQNRCIAQQAGLSHLFPEHGLSLPTESGLLTVVATLPCTVWPLSTQLDSGSPSQYGWLQDIQQTM